jgi:hypothetical protein
MVLLYKCLLTTVLRKLLPPRARFGPDARCRGVTLVTAYPVHGHVVASCRLKEDEFFCRSLFCKYCHGDWWNLDSSVYNASFVLSFAKAADDARGNFPEPLCEERVSFRIT